MWRYICGYIGIEFINKLRFSTYTLLGTHNHQLNYYLKFLTCINFADSIDEVIDSYYGNCPVGTYVDCYTSNHIIAKFKKYVTNVIQEISIYNTYRRSYSRRSYFSSVKISVSSCKWKNLKHLHAPKALIQQFLFFWGKENDLDYTYTNAWYIACAIISMSVYREVLISKNLEKNENFEIASYLN